MNFDYEFSRYTLKSLIFHWRFQGVGFNTWATRLQTGHIEDDKDCPANALRYIDVVFMFEGHSVYSMLDAIKHTGMLILQCWPKRVPNPDSSGQDYMLGFQCKYNIRFFS